MVAVTDLSVPGDLAMAPATGITGARSAADQMLPDGGALAIPIDDVVVTYLKPTSLNVFDRTGFWVQEAQLGPAIFVAVDPGTLSPSPAVGDRVSFVATGVWRSAGQRFVSSLMTWTVLSSGFDVESFRQDLSSAADLVTGLEGYDGELSTVNGTLVQAMTQASEGYVSGNMTTMGVPVMSNSLRLFITAAMRDSFDVTPGCTVTTRGPLYRFNNITEPAGWVPGDLTVGTCPAPGVASARATSKNTVVVTFDRQLDPASLLADGSQFTITGLTVSGATLTGANEVTITTTDQTQGMVYTVDAAATLKDKRNATLDPARDSATFAGFAPPATLIVNEVNPGISAGRDRVELKAVVGGSVLGFQIYQDVTPANRQLRATLPSLVVATGDFIVVHINAANGITTETNAGGKTGCTDNLCEDDAWDVDGTITNDFPFSARVVALFDANDVLVDGMPFYATGVNHPAGFPGEVQALISAGKWNAVCASPCNDANATAISINASNPAVANSVGGNSMQRNADTVPAQPSTWTTKASTWGSAN